MTAGVNIQLVRAFLRAPQFRMAAAAVTVTCALVLIALSSMQAFQQSPGQLAAAETGKAEYALRLPTVFEIGAHNQGLVDDVMDAARGAGAASVSSGYFIFDVPVDVDLAGRTSLIENDWGSDPFPSRLTLVNGNWPAAPGEVVVTPALAAGLNGRDTLSIAGGAILLSVVGVVEDDFFRDDSFGYIASGTWQTLEPTGAGYAIGASLELFWDGTVAPSSVTAAVSRALIATDSTASPEALLSSVVDRVAAERESTSTYSELFLLLLLGPFATGFVTGWAATSFIARIRQTLRTVGVFHTGAAGALAVGGTAVIAAMVGVGLGLTLGATVRPLLDYVSPTTLGPMHASLPHGVLVIGATLAGTVLSMLQLRLRAKRRTPARRLPLREYLPAAKQLLPAIIVGFIVAGVLCAQSSDTNIQIASAYMIGFAGVAVSPYVLGILTRIRPRSMAIALGVRRLSGATQQVAWTVVSVSALLMLTFTLATLYSSSIASLNARVEADVPPGQAHFSPPDSFNDAETLRAQIENYTGMSDPVLFTRARLSLDSMDGAVLVFRDPDDLARVLQVSLSQRQQADLEDGFLARPNPTEGEEVRGRIETGASITLRRMNLENVNRSFLQYGGFMLESTATTLSIPTSRSTWVYTDVSATQAKMFSSAPKALGFDPKWVEMYAAPNKRSEPPEIRMLGAGIGVIAGLVMAAFAASAARSLRPNLAALRALGVPRRWLALVLSTQIGSILVVAVCMAVAAAIAATITSIVLWLPGADLVVPWQTLSVLIGALLVTSTLSTVLALRRLDATERFVTT